MEDKTAKRRSWIKNIIIIFLAVMLILTFFSNTIMNISLPEVAVQYASPGTITTKIRGNATIEAAQTYEVKLTETRVIRDIGIKTGSVVEKGDVLFLLEADSPDLTDKEKRLEELEFAYKKALITLPEDYSSYLDAISSAQYNLNQAKAKRADEDSSAVDTAAVKREMEKAEEERTYLKNQNAGYMRKATDATLDQNTYLYYNTTDEELKIVKNEAELEAESKKAQLEALNAKEKELEARSEVLESDREKTQADYDDLLQKVGNADENNPLKEEYRILEDKLTQLEELKIRNDRTLDDLQSVLQKAYDSMMEAQSNLQAAQNALYSLTSDAEERTAAEEALKAADDAYQAAVEVYNNAAISYNRGYEDAQRDVTAKELEITRYKEDLAEKQEKLAASSAYSSELQSKKSVLAALKEQIAALGEQKNALAVSLKDAQEQYDEQKDVYLLLCITENERRIAALDKIIDNCKDKLSDAETVTDEELHRLETALSQAQASYKRALQAASVEQQKTNMDLQKQREEIDELKEEIEKLKNGTVDTEIKAPVSGEISAVNVKIGDEASMGSVLAVIQMTDRGYTASFTVTEEQARRIKVGDAATVQYYWGSSISARVEAIVTENRERRVILNITGDSVTIGSNMTFTLGDRSQNYDIVVPKTALHEDRDGNYILTVSSKSTPLGTRYTASRVDVQVIASDDANAAISGALSSYVYVITNSATPIADKMQVRLKEG